MTSESSNGRYHVQETREAAGRDAFARAVRRGLSGSPKQLDCQYIYDAAGSALFERICELDSYYPPRAEHEILTRFGAGIVARLPITPCDLVELGSGSGHKTRALLSALGERQGPVRYVPIDVSRSALEQAARSMLPDFESLTIHALAGDYESALGVLGRERPARLFVWLGSSIGNLDRAAAARFLSRLPLRPQDRALIGIDLRKARPVIEQAYDEPQGVTARFIKNILARINRELGGDFDLDAFEYRARYDTEQGYVAMDLVTARAQSVTVEGLGLAVSLAAGEPIHVERSYKYAPEEIDDLAADAGLEVVGRWHDGQRRFCDVLLRLG